MSETTHLLLPYLAAAQAQKHVTHNEALRLLDGLVQLAVLDRTRTAPPTSPADGDRHIVASGATGLWAGWDLNVAYWVDGPGRASCRVRAGCMGGRRGCSAGLRRIRVERRRRRRGRHARRPRRRHRERARRQHRRRRDQPPRGPIEQRPLHRDQYRRRRQRRHALCREQGDARRHRQLPVPDLLVGPRRDRDRRQRRLRPQDVGRRRDLDRWLHVHGSGLLLGRPYRDLRSGRGCSDAVPGAGERPDHGRDPVGQPCRRLAAPAHEVARQHAGRAGDPFAERRHDRLLHRCWGCGRRIPAGGAGIRRRHGRLGHRVRPLGRIAGQSPPPGHRADPALRQERRPGAGAKPRDHRERRQRLSR
jgi:hypothetical protein